MKLRLISANMWLLPPPFSVENRKRLNIFSNFVSKNDYDFICLQEIWLNWDVNYIRKKLSNYHFISKPNLFYNTTGLLMFSKHKPKNVNKRTFRFDRRSAFYDSLGRKGYLLCDFNVNNERLSILNAHLNSPVNSSQHKSWEIQINEIKKVINQTNNNIILTGDLNGDLDNFSDKISPIKDLTHGVKSFSQNNPYTNKGFHKYTQGIERFNLHIDHVILFSKSKNTVLLKRLIQKPLFSDHYPIHAEITI